MTLADIIRGAVGRPPWDVLDTWELWDHHNLAPTMTVCTGPQGRVLCSLLTDPTSDDMPNRWLYVDLGDTEPPTDRDTHDWLMDYLLTRMPKTVTATATGWELIALDATGLCDRTYPVHAIHATWTKSTCATWPLHRCVVVMDHARTSHRCACGIEWIDSRRPPHRGDTMIPPIRLTMAAPAAALLALAGCATSTPPAEPPPTSAAASPTATLTGKAAVEATVAAIGAANSEGGRADSTEVIWADDGPIVTIPAADNLTQGLILAGWWGDAEDVLRALQGSGVKAARATVLGTYPMQTADGEDLGEMVVIRGRWNNPLRINFDRTTAKTAVDEVTGRWAQ